MSGRQEKKLEQSEIDNQILSDDLLKEAGSLFGRLPVLGHVVWLCMNSPSHKHQLLSDLEWRVLPPMMLDMAKLFMKGDAPLGFVSWARVSEDVERRLLEGHLSMRPSDWTSGDRYWIIDVVAPFGGIKDLVESVRHSELKGHAVRQLVPGRKGQGLQAVEWPAVSPADEVSEQ